MGLVKSLDQDWMLLAVSFAAWSKSRDSSPSSRVGCELVPVDSEGAFCESTSLPGGLAVDCTVSFELTGVDAEDVSSCEPIPVYASGFTAFSLPTCEGPLSGGPIVDAFGLKKPFKLCWPFSCDDACTLEEPDLVLLDVGVGVAFPDDSLFTPFGGAAFDCFVGEELTVECILLSSLPWLSGELWAGVPR